MDFFGMHWLWWLFWVALMIVLFSWAVPVPRRTARLYRENPFEILRRRYAAGEITTAEYDERKTRIERDMQEPLLKAQATKRFDRDAPA